MTYVTFLFLNHIGIPPMCYIGRSFGKKTSLSKFSFKMIFLPCSFYVWYTEVFLTTSQVPDPPTEFILMHRSAFFGVPNLYSQFENHIYGPSSGCLLLSQHFSSVLSDGYLKRLGFFFFGY